MLTLNLLTGTKPSPIIIYNYYATMLTANLLTAAGTKPSPGTGDETSRSILNWELPVSTAGTPFPINHER
jgi:hypothetical protein